MNAAVIPTPGRRAVPEWIGATPDSPIPRIVKGRIWVREGGRCYLTGKKIMPGDAYDYDQKAAAIEAHGGLGLDPDPGPAR